MLPCYVLFLLMLTTLSTSFTSPINHLPVEIPKIDCPHFSTCSGCIVQSQLTSVSKITSARRLFSSPSMLLNYVTPPSSSETIFPVTIPTNVTNWRTQAKLVATPYTKFHGGCSFGLYKSHSHIVQTIPNCEVHCDRINEAVGIIEVATRNTKTTAYVPPSSTSSTNKFGKQSKSNGNLKTGEGMLRYIQLSLEQTTNKICATLVWNAHNYRSSQPYLTRLVDEMRSLNPSIWQGVWVNCNDSFGNVIFGREAEKWRCVYGNEFVKERIPSSSSSSSSSLSSKAVGRIHFTPNVFRQGNYEGFSKIALKIAEIVKLKQARRVCELYSGVGVIGLTALSENINDSAKGTVKNNKIEWIKCSDENPANTQCFHKSLSSMKEIPKSTRVSYTPSSASAALSNGDAVNADILIIDPPRSGLDPSVLAEVIKSKSNPSCRMATVKTLVYVSCGFDALSRDLEFIFKDGKGGWKIESVEGYLLFPGSNHVESLCVLVRD